MISAYDDDDVCLDCRRGRRDPPYSHIFPYILWCLKRLNPSGPPQLLLYNSRIGPSFAGSVHGVIMTSFCIQQLPRPCWRYTMRQQNNVVNLRMLENCSLRNYTPVELHGLRLILLYEVSYFRILIHSFSHWAHLQHGGMFFAQFNGVILHIMYRLEAGSHVVASMTTSLFALDD